MFSFIVSGQIAPRPDRHRLAGIITVDGLPAKMAVVVFDRDTFIIIAATWSNAISGEWEICGISEYPERQLLVMSVDQSGSYNAEVADYISQVATV